MSEINELSSSQGIESIESHLLDSEGLALLRKITQDPEAYLEQVSEFRQAETVEKRSVELSSEEFLGTGSDFESFLALLGENPDTAQAIIENILPEDPALISSGQAGNAVASGLDSYEVSAQAHEILESYTVTSSDTLSAIALRIYGNASYWRFIYEANHELIGDNPNIIISGQELVIPPLEDLETVPATVVRGEYTQTAAPMASHAEPDDHTEDVDSPIPEEVVIEASTPKESVTEASAGEVVEPETAVEETAVAETMMAEAPIPEESIEETLTPDVLIEEVPEAEIPSDTPTAEETEVIVEDVPSEAVSTAEAPAPDSVLPEDQAAAEGMFDETLATEEPTLESPAEEVPSAKLPLTEEIAHEEKITEDFTVDAQGTETTVTEELLVKAPIAEEPSPQEDDEATTEEILLEKLLEETAVEIPAAEVPVPEEPVEGTPIPEETVDEAPETETPPEPTPEETTTEAPTVESPPAEDPVSETPIEEIAVPEEAVDVSASQEPVTETPAEEVPVVEEPVQEDQSAEVSPEEANEGSPAQQPEPEVDVLTDEAAEDDDDEAPDDPDGGDWPSDDIDDDWPPHDEIADVTVEDFDQLQQTEMSSEEAEVLNETEAPEAEVVIPVQQESLADVLEEAPVTDAPVQESSATQEPDTGEHPTEAPEKEEPITDTLVEESQQPEIITYEQPVIPLEELHEWASQGISQIEDFIAKHLPPGWYDSSYDRSAFRTENLESMYYHKESYLRYPYYSQNEWEEQQRSDGWDADEISEFVDPMMGHYGEHKLFVESSGINYEVGEAGWEQWFEDMRGYTPSDESQWPPLEEVKPNIARAIEDHILAGNLTVEEANQLIEARGYSPPVWSLPPDLQESASEESVDGSDQIPPQYTTQEILEMQARGEITPEEAARLWEEAHEREQRETTADEGDMQTTQYTTQEILEMRLRNEITDGEAAQMWEEAFQREQRESPDDNPFAETIAEINNERGSDAYIAEKTLMSEHSYNPDEPLPEAISDWQVLSVESENAFGYSGTAYISPDGQSIIIANQGTSDLQDVLTDIPIALASPDAQSLLDTVTANNILLESIIESVGNVFLEGQLDAALTFVNQIRENYPGVEVELTGHSLGGGIAQVVGLQTGLQADTFNSAPMMEYIEEKYPAVNLDNVSNITNFRREGDPVSGYGEHLGQVIVLPNTGDGSNLLEQHDMRPFADDFQIKPPVDQRVTAPQETITESFVTTDVSVQQPSTLEQVLITGDMTPEEGIQVTSENIDELETQIGELTTLHDELSELDFTLTPGEPGLPSSTEDAVERLLSAAAAVIPGGIYIGDVVEDAVQSAEIANQLADQISQLEVELGTEQANLDILENQAEQVLEQEPSPSTHPENPQAIEPPPPESEPTVLPPEAISEMQPGIPLTDEQAEQLGVPWYSPLVPPPPMRDLWDQVWAGDLTPEEASQQAEEMGFQKPSDTWDIPPEAGEQWDQLESGEMTRQEWTEQMGEVSAESTDLEEPQVVPTEEVPVEETTAPEVAEVQEATGLEEQAAEAVIERETTETPAAEVPPEEAVAEAATIEDSVDDSQMAEEAEEAPSAETPDQEHTPEESVAEPPAAEAATEEPPAQEAAETESTPSEDASTEVSDDG